MRWKKTWCDVKKKKEMKKKGEKIKRSDVTCCAYGSVLMCLDLTWYDSLWLVQS